MENNSLSKIKSSFFDDNNEPERPITNKIWISLSNFKSFLKTLHYISNKQIFQGFLFNKSYSSSKPKKHYYVLYKDRLVRYKSNSQKEEKKIMYASGTRLLNKEIQNNEDKTLIFIKNKHSTILFPESSNDYNEWISHLKQTFILTNFNKFYTSNKIIGKGTFAKVVLCKNLLEQKDFAVKIFEKTNILSSKKANRTREGLLNEIKLMRIIDHPNIIKLYEVYEGDYHIYLVMEVLKGGELFERIIKKGQYSEKDASIMIKKLLSALCYLHEIGIMHRDIKPENLILKNENDFEIKLADFGLAEFENNNNLLFKRCGTPGYVAPEILNDEQYDCKVDIFSAGVILYILLTGCSVFHGKSHSEILKKNRQCQINYDFKINNIFLSEGAIDLLKKMLEKDPKNRISAKNALSHEWILKYELSNEKESLESSVKSEKEDQLVSAQENMKRFKEQREIKNLNITGSNSKDSTELIMNSPLITGKTDKIFCMDNMMGSPLINSHDKKYIRKTSDNNISEFHKKVLLKNVSNEKNEIFQFNLMEEEKYNECDDENSPVFDKVQKLHQRNITYKMSIEDGCIKKGSVDVDSPKEIIYKESKALFIEHNKI